MTTPLRITARFQRNLLQERTAAAPDLGVTLNDALQALSGLESWFKAFAGVLRQAEQDTEGLPSGWVWQPRFVKFFEGADVFESQLRESDDRLAGIYYGQDKESDIANAARGDLRQPRKAQIGYAIEEIQFFDHPKLGKDYIAYDVKRLKEWAAAYGKWLTDAARGLNANLKKAQRLKTNP